MEDSRSSNMVDTGKNTEKSPSDLRRLIVSQTLVNDPQVKLVWKTLNEIITIIIIIIIIIVVVVVVVVVLLLERFLHQR